VFPTPNLPDDFFSKPFEPISTPALIGCLLFAALIAYQGSTLTCFNFLHLIDLPFHEAGHVIFGVISRHLMIIGGTLGQLAFPIITGGYFWLHRKPASLVISIIWLVESLWCTAIYMADARALVMPLISGRTDGGDHDWRNLFTEWGVLEKDILIAGRVRFFGAMILLYVVYWVVQHWRRHTLRN
jgi:hypothetical protein